MAAGWLGQVLDPAVDGMPRAVDDATLIVSELVTNAVEAHSHALHLSLSVDETDPRVLTIAVEDDAPGEPTIQSGPLARPRGRGLQLVDALATGWGTEHEATHKSVWAKLSIPAPRLGS
jgi:two-component sensor histidine kinase